MSAPGIEKIFNFAEFPPMPQKKLSSMKESIKAVNSIQQDQVYFDRNYFGLLSILRKMQVKIDTRMLGMRN